MIRSLLHRYSPDDELHERQVRQRLRAVAAEIDSRLAYTRHPYRFAAIALALGVTIGMRPRLAKSLGRVAMNSLTRSANKLLGHVNNYAKNRS